MVGDDIMRFMKTGAFRINWSEYTGTYLKAGSKQFRKTWISTLSIYSPNTTDFLASSPNWFGLVLVCFFEQCLEVLCSYFRK